MAEERPSRGTSTLWRVAFVLVLLQILAGTLYAAWIATPALKRPPPVEAQIASGSKRGENTPLFVGTQRATLYKYRPPRPRNPLDANNHSACGTSPLYRDYFRLTQKERSSSDEDRLIYELFFRNHSAISGTDTGGGNTLSPARGSNMKYVELGAFNGMDESNTRFYDKCLHWDGVLIEANPKMYQDLLFNRPHAHTLSFAASCNATQEAANATVKFWASVFTNAVEDASIGRAAYANGPQERLVSVPCGGLTAPLLDTVGPRIHFFSLDVEGMEPRVLATLDLTRIFVDVFMIESSNAFCGRDCPSRDAVRAHLQRHGYRLAMPTIPRSDLFVHPQSPYLRFVQSRLTPVNASGVMLPLGRNHAP